MEQYSPKNQAFLLAQMPTATDVRPFKAWKAAGRSVIKGEKALRVWIPKARNEKADPESLTEDQQRARFVRGPVFDISQTKECAPRHRKAADGVLAEHRHEQAWTDYAAAIDAGDIPDTLDFADWYELREEMIRSRITKQADADERATEDETDRWLSSVIERRDGNAGDYTIASASGAIIAQVEHHAITY